MAGTWFTSSLIKIRNLIHSLVFDASCGSVVSKTMQGVDGSFNSNYLDINVHVGCNNIIIRV